MNVAPVFPWPLGHPLVPSREEDQVGVAFDGPLELLFEIGSRGALFGRGIRGLVAALAFGRIARVAAADVPDRVAGHHDGYLLLHVALRRKFAPCPAVLTVAVPVAAVVVLGVEPRVAEREAAGNSVPVIPGRCEEQRFAVEFVPQAVVVAVAVERQQFFDHRGGVRVEDERDFRPGIAFALHLDVDVAERFDHRKIGVAVRYVDEDHVDACLREHLGMAADYPGVVGNVIVQIGFAPMVHGASGTEGDVGRIAVAFLQLADVVGRPGVRGLRRDDVAAEVVACVVAVGADPDKVENAYFFVTQRLMTVVRTQSPCLRGRSPPGIRFRM